MEEELEGVAGFCSLSDDVSTLCWGTQWRELYSASAPIFARAHLEMDRGDFNEGCEERLDKMDNEVCWKDAVKAIIDFIYGKGWLNQAIGQT